MQENSLLARPFASLQMRHDQSAAVHFLFMSRTAGRCFSSLWFSVFWSLRIVMNIKFMMEFTNSHSKSCEFLLHLSLNSNKIGDLISSPKLTSSQKPTILVGQFLLHALWLLCSASKCSKHSEDNSAKNSNPNHATNDEAATVWFVQLPMQDSCWSTVGLFLSPTILAFFLLSHKISQMKVGAWHSRIEQYQHIFETLLCRDHFALNSGAAHLNLDWRENCGTTRHNDLLAMQVLLLFCSTRDRYYQFSSSKFKSSNYIDVSICISAMVGSCVWFTSEAQRFRHNSIV